MVEMPLGWESQTPDSHVASVTMSTYKKTLHFSGFGFLTQLEFGHEVPSIHFFIKMLFFSVMLHILLNLES